MEQQLEFIGYDSAGETWKYGQHYYLYNEGVWSLKNAIIILEHFSLLESFRNSYIAVQLKFERVCPQ